MWGAQQQGASACARAIRACVSPALVLSVAVAGESAAMSPRRAAARAAAAAAAFLTLAAVAVTEAALLSGPGGSSSSAALAVVIAGLLLSPACAKLGASHPLAGLLALHRCLATPRLAVLQLLAGGGSGAGGPLLGARLALAGSASALAIGAGALAVPRARPRAAATAAAVALGEFLAFTLATGVNSGAELAGALAVAACVVAAAGAIAVAAAHATGARARHRRASSGAKVSDEPPVALVSTSEIKPSVSDGDKARRSGGGGAVSTWEAIPVGGVPGPASVLDTRIAMGPGVPAIDSLGPLRQESRRRSSMGAVRGPDVESVVDAMRAVVTRELGCERR
jgi:hypothetical protein